MATAHLPRTSMSDEAFKLINDLYGGVDVVVRELAEQIAIEEESYLDNDPSVVAIEEQHVKEAGRQVLQALRQLMKDHKLPPEAQKRMPDLLDCGNTQ